MSKLEMGVTQSVPFLTAKERFQTDEERRGVLLSMHSCLDTTAKMWEVMEQIKRDKKKESNDNLTPQMVKLYRKRLDDALGRIAALPVDSIYVCSDTKKRLYSSIAVDLKHIDRQFGGYQCSEETRQALSELIKENIYK